MPDIQEILNRVFDSTNVQLKNTPSGTYTAPAAPSRLDVSAILNAVYDSANQAVRTVF